MSQPTSSEHSGLKARLEGEYASRFTDSQIRFPGSMGRSDAGGREEVQSTSADLDMEVECIQLYFANLHLVYSILDQPTFLARCKDEIWGRRQSGPTRPLGPNTSRFLSLYCAVLAIGALTAGESSLLVKDEKRVRAFLATHTSPVATSTSGRRTYVRPSFELAYFFHVCTKALLGDIYEASSLEASQTLLLMVRREYLPGV